MSKRRKGKNLIARDVESLGLIFASNFSIYLLLDGGMFRQVNGL